MGEDGWLTERFEENRSRLHGVAYRMLGSRSEAEDAVQEAWLRLTHADAAAIENLGGWLTTVVSRLCLDILRGRKQRREDPMAAQVTEPRAMTAPGADPEQEALLADSVGVAMLVVLDTLGPAERLAFVLHDLLGLPFDEVGSILGRSPGAAKQLASRARRRVRGSPVREGSRSRQREVVEAFLEAVRVGDLAGLLAVLDPEAVLHIDAAARVDGVVRVDAPAAEAGQPRELRGATTWAARLIALTRGLPARFVQLVEIDGAVGVIFAPRGQLVRAMIFTFAGDRIARIESVGDPVRLRHLVVRVP
jgi:RNA polymerase sigma-70 factor (ECF subfamily)